MKNSKRIYTLVAALSLIALWAIIQISFRQTSPPKYVDYYKIAEQHEQNKNWRSARSAWLLAKASADTISQNISEANGRQAYCDYRIGMTYNREGNRDQAVANIQLALTTQASDINSFLGKHGTSEIKTDLSDIMNSTP